MTRSLLTARVASLMQETDKAFLELDAQEDGVLAKILVSTKPEITIVHI